jgi:hypothetical protein
MYFLMERLMCNGGIKKYVRSLAVKPRGKDYMKTQAADK